MKDFVLGFEAGGIIQRVITLPPYTHVIRELVHTENLDFLRTMLNHKGWDIDTDEQGLDEGFCQLTITRNAN